MNTVLGKTSLILYSYRCVPIIVSVYTDNVTMAAGVTGAIGHVNGDPMTMSSGVV